MTKTAIFVEGQTELVFVREYLLKSFYYQNISIECYTLFSDNSINKTEYAFPNDLADSYFQIINVGGDNSVLTRLLNREQYLWNVGFNRIIGLRDMYSKNYRELTTKQGQIDESLNQEFIQETLSTLQTRAKQPDKIDFCFAIMEGESWILGFHDCFEKINPLLNSSFINEKLGYDLEKLDPEITFFHPANVVKDIYQLAGENYSKSKGNIEAIMASLQKDDFDALMNSSKCSSFKQFVKIVHK
jgi:hypothetical protein